MIHRFFRHIKEGFYGVGRHLGMALSSATAVMITLVLISLFLILTVNLFEMTRTIEESISISALIQKGAESSHEQIESKILMIEGVKSVDYRSREDEFNYYLETQTSDDLKDFYNTYRDVNPFRANILVEIEDGEMLQGIKAQIEKIDGIDEVADGGANTYTLIGILSNVRIFGGALVLSLCILAIYLVYNTIKITIASRSDEIWIMRHVGAKNGYIRAPFLVEGVIIGFLGSILPILISVFGYIYVYKKIGGSFFGAFVLLPPHPFILYIAGILVAIGVIVGFVGSYISVCKYLRMKR
ncbi:MAG: permease-like cell division protein FtsX [Erysipelotrichaceae bacterium]|nr:permease-like cell division protein FtsX [Erysipelotrichaceae bacterium]